MSRRIYVDTLHLVTADGAKRPKFTEPLRDLLRLRGFDVIRPNVDAAGNEARPPAADASVFSIERLVLLKSQLIPALGGTAEMEVQGVLKRPNAGGEVELGPFGATIPLEAGEFVRGGITPQGLKRILTELYLPLVNKVDQNTP